MKLKALLISVIAVLLLFTGCSNGNTADIEAPEGMKLFSNEHVDYTAFVPLSWTIDMSTGTLSAYVSSADSSNVSITAQALSAPMSADDYWKSYEEDFKATFDDMEYEGDVPTTTTLSDLAANKYVYTASVTGNQYKFMQTVCVKGTTVYIITYTSTPDKYDSNLEDVYKILDNFSFNG